MPHYVLRDVPQRLWTRVRERAHAEGWPVRALVLRLLEDYAAGQIEPSGAAPPRGPTDGEDEDRHPDREQGKRRVTLQVQLLAEGAGFEEVHVLWNDASDQLVSTLSMSATAEGRSLSRALRLTFSDLEDMPGDELVSRDVQHRVRTWFLAGLTDQR